MHRIASRLLGLLIVVAVAGGIGCDDGADEVEETETADQQQQTADEDEVERQEDEASASEDQESNEESEENEDDESASDEDDQADDTDEDDQADDADEDSQANDEDERAGLEEETEKADDDGRESEDVAQLSAEDFEHLPIRAVGPVAVVDGEEIPAVEFNVMAEQQLAAVPPEAVQTQSQQIKQMLIQGVVSGYLVEREIERQNIEVSETDIDEAIEQFEQVMEAQAGDQLGEMQALMEQQGIDDAALRAQAEKQLAAEELIADSGNLEVTEQELRRHFEQNKAQFHHDEPQVRARHILLNVDDHDGEESNDDELHQKAKRIAGELDGSSEDFAAKAREHSDCPSGPEGGDLGYFTRDQLMPEFTEAAFDLPAGQISKPVRSNLGWHVILVEDRREEGGPEFEEVREELEMTLEAQRLQQASVQLVQRLQNEAEIETKEENVVVGG